MVSRHILPLIEEAARRVYSVVRENALAPLPREAGALGVAKLEQLQITGSFKLRGAVNKLMSLSKAEAAAASSPPPPAIMGWASPRRRSCWASTRRCS